MSERSAVVLKEDAVYVGLGVTVFVPVAGVAYLAISDHKWSIMNILAINFYLLIKALNLYISQITIKFLLTKRLQMQPFCASFINYYRKNTKQNTTKN